MKKIPIGISNFRELGETEYVFFDKILMIQDFLIEKVKLRLSLGLVDLERL